MKLRQSEHRQSRRFSCLLVSLWVVIAAFTGVASAHAGPTNGWHMTAAGSEVGLWVLSPTRRPRQAAEAPAPESGQLHYFPASAPMGTAMGLRAHTLGKPPAVMTASGDRLVFLYPGVVTPGGDPSHPHAKKGRTFPVRSLRLTLVRPPVVFLDPPDRFTAEPPLRTQGALLHAVDTDSGLFALLWVDGHLSLAGLDRNGWRKVAVPEDLDRAAPARLLRLSGGVSLLSRDQSGRATLWSFDSAEGSWSRAPAPDDAVGRRLFTAGGVIIVPEHNGSTRTLSLRSIEGEHLLPLATVSGVASDHAVAAFGENAAVVWLDEDVSARLRVVIISSITGRTLYDGYARFPPPLTPSDLRLVMVLLSAVMLGVLLFVLKPETMAESSPPTGCLLAEPGRRFGAAGVDLLIAGVISSALWGVALAEAVNPNSLLLLTGNDSWPIVTTIAIYFVHGVLGEWLFGRTLGKVILGCRVRSVRGGRVRGWQAVTRNLVKGMAPPLVVLILFEPNRRHPGDLLGGTMVVKNAPAETEASAGDGSDAASDERLSQDKPGETDKAGETAGQEGPPDSDH